MNKKKEKLFNESIALIKAKGYQPVVQGVWYHFKDGNMNFYPTTGIYFDDETREKGKIKDLPVKGEHIEKYYNLDKRYLPDWVLSEKRQKWLKKFLQNESVSDRV